MERTNRQARRGLALMLAASGLLLFAAWLTRPMPVVRDSVQTELLSIHVDLGEEGYLSWYPENMVQRQTARAITDHMARCREQNTLRRAAAALEEAPRIQLYFRTEDHYRVVHLGSRRDPAAQTGWSGDRDREGLAARVLDSEELSQYIMEQIGGDLPSGT